MKYLRQVCAVVALTCAFALTSFAGEMSAPPIAPPSATDEMDAPSVSRTGQMGTGVTDLARGERSSQHAVAVSSSPLHLKSDWLPSLTHGRHGGGMSGPGRKS